jgi:hypothetical protein
MRSWDAWHGPVLVEDEDEDIEREEAELDD